MCALFCGPMVFVQCSPWAARSRLFLMGAQCTAQMASQAAVSDRRQGPLLFTFCASFHSTGFGASCSLRVSPGHAPVPTSAATLCWDLSIGTSLPPQVGESVPAAVLLAIFHPLPTSVLKEPLLEGASQHPPVRDRFLLCRLFVRVGFLFRCGLGMGDA